MPEIKNSSSVVWSESDGELSASAVLSASDVGALPDSTTASDINAVPQTSSTGAAELPTGTQGDRPTPEAGMLRFNSDTNQFEGYDGTAWGDIGGGAEANNAGAILAAQVFG